MKRATQNAVRTAWGLELTQTSAELVRLERNGSDDVKVEHRQTYDVGTFWDTGMLNGEIGAQLAQIPSDQPLAICIPDRSVFCRGVALPKSSQAATAKMIQSQADAMFGGSDDRLCWTWQGIDDPRNPAMQWVLLCAAQKHLLEQIRRATPGMRLLVPRTVALATISRSPQALMIELNDHTATFALLVDSRLRRSVVVDTESDGSNGSIPSWIRQARQSYQSLLEGLPRECWPQEGVVRGGDSEAAGTIAEALAGVLGVKLKVDAIGSAADAAARLVLDDATNRTVNFATADEQPAPRSSELQPRRMALAVGACVLAILLLFGIDEWRARWLSRQLQQLHAAESSSSGIERRLAVDRYLEKNASPALPGLDAILAAAPPSLQMNSFGLNAAGQFHLSGILGGSNEVDDFLRKLQQSKVLTNVQLRSARNDQNRWTVELTADATPMAGLLLGQSKPPPTSQTSRGGGA